MIINYFGHSYFFIEGKDYSIAIDPFSNVGLDEIKVNSDYVFCSHNHFDHQNASLVSGAKPVKNGYPFEIISCYHDEKCGALRGKNDILVFEIDGFRCAHLGDLGEYENQDIIKKLKGVDLLFIPVGGKYTIDSVGAYEYAVKTGAKAVIPMHYKAGSSKIDIQGVKPFLDKFDTYKKVSSPYKYSGEKGVIHVEFEGENL